MAVMEPANFELALETCPPNQLPLIIKDNPDMLHYKFWHGMSALHKLCMRVDVHLEVIAFVIESGADVNAVNNFGETSLMFAAKRGNIQLFDLILNSGADMQVKDKIGRTVIHHSVLGGSIHMVHYLSIVHGLQLDLADEREQNCLHIAASMGNEAMTKYLLKFDRCDPKKSDVYGNTPLHNAATYAHESTVYELLKSSGLSIVDSRNQKGLTAADICDGKTLRHQSTLMLLQWAARQKSHGYRYLHPPRALLLWYLLMPTIIFLGGLIVAGICQQLIGWFTGSIIMTGTVLYILYLYMVHTHRIKHHSRLPNPMHAGAFGAGLIGTFLVWLTQIVPYTDFSNITNVLLVFVSMTISPFMYYTYGCLLTKDPGFLPLPDRATVTSPAMVQAMRAPDAARRFCPFCCIVTSGNIKHCKLCERCVVHMDHHCLYLMTCVATLNHKRFVILIFLVNLAILFYLISVVRHLYFLYSGEDLATVLSNAAMNHLLVFWTTVLNSASLFWGINLLRWSINYISQGVTYYQSLGKNDSSNHSHCDNASNLSLKQRLHNVVRFFREHNSLSRSSNSTNM